MLLRLHDTEIFVARKLFVASKQIQREREREEEKGKERETVVFVCVASVFSRKW